MNTLKTPELIRKLLDSPFEYSDFSELAAKYESNLAPCISKI